jgi:hypothetical protein
MNQVEETTQLIEIGHVDKQVIVIRQDYPCPDLHPCSDELLKEFVQ